GDASEAARSLNIHAFHVTHVQSAGRKGARQSREMVSVVSFGCSRGLAVYARGTRPVGTLHPRAGRVSLLRPACASGEAVSSHPAEQRCKVVPKLCVPAKWKSNTRNCLHDKAALKSLV